MKSFDNMDPSLKAKIDAMSHYQLCERWRFAKSGDPLFQSANGDYFKHKLFDEYGGFTPEISKQLGWA
jgi:hypothetical protein